MRLLDPVIDIDRRGFIAGGAAAVLLVACSSDDEAAPPTGEVGGDGFPRTVTHGLGRTVIPRKPTRIVASADRDQLDAVLAMGVKPVQYGVSGDYDGVAPWVDASLVGNLDGVRMAGAFEPNLELIAAARPDLILDAWSEPTVHESLSAIAPTVQLKTDNTDSWDSAQELAGEATGEDAAARLAVRETEDTIGAQALRLAAVEGRTVAVAFVDGDELVILPGTEIGGRIVDALGVKMVSTPDGKSGRYSLERIGELLVDVDIILSFTYGGEDAQLAQPLFRQLPVVSAGGYVPLDTDTATACYQESSLSLRWAAAKVADALLTGAAGRGSRPG